MKLISMTDFVLEQSKKIMNCELTHLESHHQIVDYANFLKQPLKLEMFVPCDEGGNPLKEPYDEIGRGNWIKTSEKIISEMSDKYQQAKEKVLFEGFDLSTAKFHCDRNDRAIEYFTSFEVKLTPNAIKRIFG